MKIFLRSIISIVLMFVFSACDGKRGESITGPSGMAGTDGKNGRGEQGIQGIQGVSGTGDGKDGEQGIQGIQGIQGEQGIPGTGGTGSGTGYESWARPPRADQLVHYKLINDSAVFDAYLASFSGPFSFNGKVEKFTARTALIRAQGIKIYITFTTDKAVIISPGTLVRVTGKIKSLGGEIYLMDDSSVVIT